MNRGSNCLQFVVAATDSMDAVDDLCAIVSTRGLNQCKCIFVGFGMQSLVSVCVCADHQVPIYVEVAVLDIMHFPGHSGLSSWVGSGP